MWTHEAKRDVIRRNDKAIQDEVKREKRIIHAFEQDYCTKCRRCGWVGYEVIALIRNLETYMLASLWGGLRV